MKRYWSVQKSQGGKRFATIYDPLVQVETPASKLQNRSGSGQGDIGR